MIVGEGWAGFCNFFLNLSTVLLKVVGWVGAFQNAKHGGGVLDTVWAPYDFFAADGVADRTFYMTTMA